MADLGAWNGGDKNRRARCFFYFLNLNHNCFEITLFQLFFVSLLEFVVEFLRTRILIRIHGIVSNWSNFDLSNLAVFLKKFLKFKKVTIL